MTVGSGLLGVKTNGLIVVTLDWVFPQRSENLIKIANKHH